MEDLLKFFQTNNLTKFSSSDSGYKLCVQVPATFEVDENIDDDHRGMMKLKIKVFHLDLNRNGSFVSKKAAKDAMPTIKNRPIMAYIHQRDDGEWDFEAHNMTINTDEDGNDYFEYQEKQVGSFDESDPFFEYDEELDKTFVCAYAYISEDYTRACDIIRRKGGTKNSVELSIEELAYNAKESYLDLQKFYVSASTLLGSYNDGTEVAEGMLGSRADIVDFSEQNNSILSNSDFIDSIAEVVMQRLGNIKMDNSINYTNGKEESGLKKDKLDFDETKVKTTKEAEAAETPEVVENVENFEDEDEDLKDDDVKEDSELHEGENVEDEVEPDNEETEENEETNDESVDDEIKKLDNSLKYSATFNGLTRSCFATLNEQLEALWILVNDTYGESDNEWYSIDADPDKKIVYMHGWNNHYRQSYKVKSDVYSLTGDRVRIYPLWVSEDERKEIENMKFNYSAIESELNAYKEKELHAQRESILSSDDYAVMKDYAEFNELKSNMDNYAVEELTKEADLLYAKYMKSNYSNFSANNQDNKKIVFMSSGESDSKKERLPYGGLFENFKNK